MDWLILGSGTWRGTAYTEHNLARALAHEDRVLFLDPPLSPLTPLRVRHERRSLLERRPQADAGLHWLRPLALPPLGHPLARRLSLPLLRQQLRSAARRVGLDRPVVFNASYRPGLRAALPAARHVTLVHDWIPAGADLLGLPAGALEAEVDAVCAEADVIVVISQALKETLAARGHDAVLVRHGFPSDLATLFDGDAPPPADLAALPRPRLGYTGTIDGRIAFAALERVARENPSGSVVLIGPVSPRLDRAPLDRLLALGNVHLLGARPRADIPRHLVHLDCLLMPYVEDEWGRHGSPLKLWEYLYAGPPLAATGYTELRLFPPPLVHFASPEGALAGAVAAALADGPGGARDRRAYAAERTWGHRAAELRRAVQG